MSIDINTSLRDRLALQMYKHGGITGPLDEVEKVDEHINRWSNAELLMEISIEIDRVQEAIEQRAIFGT